MSSWSHSSYDPHSPNSEAAWDLVQVLLQAVDFSLVVRQTLAVVLKHDPLISTSEVCTPTGYLEHTSCRCSM